MSVRYVFRPGLYLDELIRVSFVLIMDGYFTLQIFGKPCYYFSVYFSLVFHLLKLIDESALVNEVLTLV